MASKCRICDGTGKLVLLNGWLADTRDKTSFRRERCGICAGSGESTYRDPQYSREQAKLRDAYKKARRAVL